MAAVLPNSFIVDFNDCFTFIIIFFSAKSEQAGAGYIININAVNFIIAGDVEYLKSPILLSLMFSTGFKARQY